MNSHRHRTHFQFNYSTSSLFAYSFVFSLSSSDDFARHQQYLVRSFVEDNRLMRWCPAQRCTYAVRVLNSSPQLAIKCRCGYGFCFKCGEENHAPITCEQLNEWLQKCKNESETAHWIIANCFPAADHQILTEHGFMYLKDVLAHFAVTSTLSIACPVDDRLEYHDITIEDVTQATGTHRHIQFQTPTSAKHDTRTAGIDSNMQHTSRQVSLCPTDNHLMYARIGLVNSVGEWMDSSKTEPTPFHLQHAGDIFQSRTDSTRQSAVQFMTRCRNGVMGSDWRGMSFVGQLHLTTHEQVVAFMRLAGFWSEQAILANNAIVLRTRSHKEEAYTQQLLDKLPVAHSVAGTNEWHILDSDWFNRFQSSRTSFLDVSSSWLRLCGADLLRAFINGRTIASGEVDSHGGMIRCSDVRQCEYLQCIMIQAGYTATFDRVVDDVVSSWRVYYSTSSLVSAPFLRLNGSEVSERKLTGTVWCVTVPTAEHLIIVRRVLETDQSGETIMASRPVIVGNTKKCPKCSIRIEKNQGCMHVGTHQLIRILFFFYATMRYVRQLTLFSVILFLR